MRYSKLEDVRKIYTMRYSKVKGVRVVVRQVECLKYFRKGEKEDMTRFSKLGMVDIIGLSYQHDDKLWTLSNTELLKSM